MGDPNRTAPAVPDPLDAAATPAGDDALVARLVDELPVGLAVRRRGEARAFYANRVARTLAEGGDGVDYEHDTRAATVAGQDYEVTVSTDAAEHHRVEAELTRRAFFDDLTGLPKRDLFEQTLNAMIGEDCPPFALSFIDVDNFKYVNDYHGHAVGDELLRKIVRRIRDAMRPTDLLARVGGDEFVLLTTPVSTLERPGPEIERLSERFREPFFIDGYEIFSSASVGVSFYPLHGRTYGVLRANADSAMYRVKGTTKGGVCLFDATLGHAAAERMEVEQRLRLAIRDKRICCAFQPKVDFRTDTVVGMEVLLRWQDENGEIRAPGEILKLANELGLMDEVALMVLERVTEQIDDINDAFGTQASISLNVAARQAGDVEFMTRFIDALVATGYPERFILELTEEAFLSRGEFQATILPMVRAIGARVSIDDFGVGYSSLSALAEITADELKVDRTFITDIHRKPRNQSILKMIELLGNALGMRIVVEGVETFEELAYLMGATRITCAQGFYFSKPMLLHKRAASYGDLRDNLLPRDSPSSRDAGAGRETGLSRDGRPRSASARGRR